MISVKSVVISKTNLKDKVLAMPNTIITDWNQHTCIEYFIYNFGNRFCDKIFKPNCVGF